MDFDTVQRGSWESSRYAKQFIDKQITDETIKLYSKEPLGILT